LQRVKDAYEVARQSVEEELSHHRTTNSGQSNDGNNHRQEQQRQEYNNNHYVASPKQLDYIWQLCKGIKNLDRRTLEKYCDSKFGKASCQLTSREASQLIEDLKAAKNGGGGLAV